MRTNLIQSYLNNNTNVAQQYNSDTTKKNFDVHQELSNRTFIKPLPSNGHLVNNTLFDMPSELFKDLKYNVKALNKSIKGKANDHELGTLNDFGMKLGGLGIATYLYSRKLTPLSKTMEFVGLASFFAAMDIWPKLALQLPAYLVHGFNIRQKYRDNYGTKKPVFLDHQFIPWDLYSDEKINKIGDRMRVPKDMKNRRDFIQEKMRKIALQNNTMWMLTSGFATPIMSALICDALQKPIANYQDKRLNKKADAILTNFHNEIDAYDFTEKTKSFETLLESNKDRAITPDLFKEISKNLSVGLDTITARALETDLRRTILTEGSDISASTFDKVGAALKDVLKSLPEKEVNAIIPSANEIIDKLEISPDKKNALKSGEAIKGVTEYSDYVKAILNATDEKIENFATQNPDNKNIKKIKFTFKELMNTTDNTGISKISAIFKSRPASVLTEESIKRLKKVHQVINNYNAKQMVLNRYTYMKAAQAPETSLANSWNGVLTDDVLKVFGVTDKEIKATRMDSKLVEELMRGKFEDIVSDKTKYETVVKKLVDKLTVLDSRTQFAEFDKYSEKTDNAYRDCVDKTFDPTAKALRENGMEATARRLKGYDVPGQVDSHCLKDLQMSFVQDRVRGVRSSFYRILNTLDMFKRISDRENIGSIKGYTYKLGGKDEYVKFSREAQEEMAEMTKQLLMGGKSSDYAVKFFFLRNPELNPTNLTPEQREKYFTDIETKGGKVLNEFFGNVDIKKLADNPHDRNFYDSAMKLMYGENLSNDTYNLIKDSNFINNFIKYRNESLSYFGGDKYFVKPNHLVNEAKNESTTEFRFQLLGSSVNDMFTKLFSSKYNSKKWLNMFGGLGAAVLGITLVSQFFMGRMSSDKLQKENK